MKIYCTVYISNRRLPALGVRNKAQRYVKSTLALCKHPNSTEYFIILFTNQNKNGTKYCIKNNIKGVLTRFINEGKCTIQVSQPEHDIFINGDVIQLKGFLHLLKRILENKISAKELTVSSMAVTPIKAKDIAPTKLVISKRSDYPVSGFPRTLEELYINDVRRCGFDKGILQLNRLRILDLSHNCIGYIPEELNKLPNLRELNFSHNLLNAPSSQRKWSWIGGCLSKTLQHLDLSYNGLEELPNQISKLHSLINLNINNNVLSTLPMGIGNLNNLKIFSASNNKINILPGSMKKLRLQSIDLSNNTFAQCIPDRSNDTAKPLPVCTLKEYAARKVLGARLLYSPEILPLTVINYLDNANFCVCGKACFDVYMRNPQNVLLTTIAQNASTSQGEIMYVPFDCYYCSLKCKLYSSYQNRQRHPIVR